MPTKSDQSPPTGERLQKVLAAAGLGSRRQCEELIVAGRVEVDRQVVTELGTRVDADAQGIRVDGVVVRAPKRFYYVLNKPPGVLSTARDQWHRTRVIDLIDSDERLFTVGRLDKASSGLILVTNDGELANRLAHPRYRVEKTYLATVAGHPNNEALGQLRRGVYLAEGPARPVSVRVKSRQKKDAVLEIVLTEGRNREIRRMLARVGHKVTQLRRTALGPLRLGDLPVGSHRQLTRAEVRALQMIGQGKGQGRRPRRAKPKKPPEAAARRGGEVSGEARKTGRVLTYSEGAARKGKPKRRQKPPSAHPQPRRKKKGRG